VGQIEPRNRGLCRELDRPIRIQALLDASLGCLKLGGVPRDSSYDPIARSRSIQICMSHRASQLETAVCRVHPCATPLHFHGRKERADASANHLLYCAQPAVSRVPCKAYAHPITVHDATHLIRGQEHAVPHPVDAHEPVASPVRADRALYDASSLRRGGSAFRATLVPRGWGSRFCLRLTGPVRAAMLRIVPLGRVTRLGSGAVIAVAAPELRSTRAQLTAPDPVRRFRRLLSPSPCPARVAELVDALVSGTSG
jgi:hypothetical protein